MRQHVTMSMAVVMLVHYHHRVLVMLLVIVILESAIVFQVVAAASVVLLRTMAAPWCLVHSQIALVFCIRNAREFDDHEDCHQGCDQSEGSCHG